MEIARVFENGRSQAIRLPKKFRFDVDEVIVQRLGKAVVLVPQNTIWDTFMNGINDLPSRKNLKVFLGNCVVSYQVAYVFHQ